MGLAGAIAQWMQGVPTQKTQLIGDILQLNGSKTNAEFIRGVMARIIAAGVVPGLEPAIDRVDVGGPRSPQRRGNALDAELLDRMADGSDYSDRGGVSNNTRMNQWISAPESIPPNSDRAKAQAWYAVDVAKGNAVAPDRFAEIAQSGDAEDNSYSLPVQGGGEWRN
jgi:hypothetical protein